MFKLKFPRCIALMAIAVAAIIFGLPSAQANPVVGGQWFDFEWQTLKVDPDIGVTLDVKGKLHTVGDGSTFSLVDELIGTRNGVAIELVPPGSILTIFDNQIVNTSPYVNDFGICYRYKNGTGPDCFALYLNFDLGLIEAYNLGGIDYAQKVKMTLLATDAPPPTDPVPPPTGGGGTSHVPEPASLALVPLALFGAMVTRRRKIAC